MDVTTIDNMISMVKTLGNELTTLRGRLEVLRGGEQPTATVLSASTERQQRRQEMKAEITQRILSLKKKPIKSTI